MSNINDADFRAAIKANFGNDNKKAEVAYENIELHVNSDTTVAAEVLQIYNAISTAYTLGYSYAAFLDMLDSVVARKCIDDAGVAALVSKWLTHCGELNTTSVVAPSDYVVSYETPVKSWDEYFYNIAAQAARNSKCFSRHIGAVLVRDNSILGTGYNSPPRGVPPCDTRWVLDKSFNRPERNSKYLLGKCPRKVLGYKSGEGTDLCVASHAEESAIVNCARMGIATKDASLYLTCGQPFGKCAVKIINAGIKEVVVSSLAYYDNTSQYLFDHSTVSIRLYDFMENKK